jgi:dephospho-CoA kinase
MFIVGLTGGIGSGKSAASDYLQQQNITIVDADLISRQVVEPNSPTLTKIAAYFGNDILLADGTLDRAKTRKKIFNNPDNKQWLENLLHPLIRQEILQQLNRSTSSYTVLVSPLLFEAEQDKLCDRILVIDCPEQLQIDRASSRDNNDPTQVQRIIASQIPRQQRLDRADDIIENTGTLNQLHHQLEQLHKRYLTLAKQKDASNE